MTRRRIEAQAWLAFGMVVALPALAEAQLFPNRPIKRQRESCAAEPPFNAHVRRDYFGYYPTCWSRFPEGWACPCPNPELPDPAASYRLHPRDPLGNLDQPAAGANEGDAAMPDTQPPAEEGALPLPDRGRSPFNTEGLGNPGGRPSGAAAPTPPDASLPPRGASTPAPTIGNKPAGSVGLLEMPTVPEISPAPASRTSLEPGSMILAPEVAQASTASAASRELGPLPVASPPNSSIGFEPETVLGQSAPAQAPHRRGILGGLFGSGNKRRR